MPGLNAEINRLRSFVNFIDKREVGETYSISEGHRGCARLENARSVSHFPSAPTATMNLV
jgi:hypothetical protein